MSDESTSPTNGYTCVHCGQMRFAGLVHSCPTGVPFSFSQQYVVTGIAAERDWEKARADRAEADLAASREQVKRLASEVDTLKRQIADMEKL